MINIKMANTVVVISVSAVVGNKVTKPVYKNITVENNLKPQERLSARELPFSFLDTQPSELSEETAT